MNKQIKLNINMDFIKSIAKDKFVSMSKDESLWEKTNEKLEKTLDPVCIYSIYSGLEREGSELRIGEHSIHSSVFSTMPEEIIGECAVFVISLGDNEKGKGILDEALIHMLKIAYIEAIREQLRMDLQEDHLLGSYFAPGIGDMRIEEIKTLADLVDFEQAGVRINDSYVMIPEKSMAGIYMFFNEEHPENKNSCDTCMARGHGCDLCSVERD